jgi:hypothetical protein
MSNSIAERLRPSDLVAEYDEKQAALPEFFRIYTEARDELQMSCSVMGAYGGDIWRGSKGDPSPNEMEKVLRKSAWRRLYTQWIKQVATAKDKSRIETMLEDPPEFTINDIRDQFGSYVLDPWGAVLRGLAEVFCGLDPYYKSHVKVKIGANKLPKRVIIAGFTCLSSGGRDKTIDIVNALRAYRREPMTDYAEISGWIEAVKKNDRLSLSEITSKIDDSITRKDDLELRIHENGNGHIFFGQKALEDINKALAEYYGDVLPDAEDSPSRRKESTEVSKDLQYYPTPQKLSESIIYNLAIKKGEKGLDPSCGCGRFLDAFSKAGGSAFGVEYDNRRANEARAKGHNVRTANFLDLEPEPVFDYVIMNPPFYGKHYVKHVDAAIKWLKSGGRLISILPVTARYDHKIINKKWLEERGASLSNYDSWRDFPVGSFSESGTNVNTTQLTVHKS